MPKANMSYVAVPLPFQSRVLPDGDNLAISCTGDHAFLTDEELIGLRAPDHLSLSRKAELQARSFLASGSLGSGHALLRASRQAARRETYSEGPALHIIVPTLWCGHSCPYCQVSRSLDETRHTMTRDVLASACTSVFQSSAKSLTVEFQGGDPLLRFDLVQEAIERITDQNRSEGRAIRFVVASTLHQLNTAMARFFADHKVYLSTSVDGPAHIHNPNRPLPTRDSYERTIAGIKLAREVIGHDCVSALMTTTRRSLVAPEEIVDEYVRLGLSEIFLRPLSPYGFASRAIQALTYSQAEFASFYDRALQRVLDWNDRGVAIREVYASIVLNKILSPFDAGYVDLQSPNACGQAVLVYNYDGFVYPSDEARMLAETGDTSLRLGPIGASLDDLHRSDSYQRVRTAGDPSNNDSCERCAYNSFCSPNPIEAHAFFDGMDVTANLTAHCQRHLWLFDSMFMRLKSASPARLDLFHEWATPGQR